MGNKKADTKTEKKVSKEKEKVNHYPILLSSAKGKLKISETLERQINYMHAMVGDAEWSGVLLYEIIKGDFDNPEKLKVIARGLYPMNIGSAAYTEYDFDENNVLDMHDYYPQIIENNWRQGHIHSHHNMQTFFSGTDQQELRDNTPNHAYYLSLIVNFKKTYSARLCVMGEREVIGKSNIGFKNIIGANRCASLKISSKESIVYAIDMDIEIEKDSFYHEVEKLKIRDEAEKVKKEEEKAREYWAYSSEGQSRTSSSPKQLNMFNPNELNNRDYTAKDQFTDNVRTFIYRIISVDTSASGHLPSLIIKMDQKFLDFTEKNKEDYSNSIESEISDIYHSVFLDPDMEEFDIVMEEAVRMLDAYAMTHEFAEFIITVLECYVPEEESEIETKIEKSKIGYERYPY